MDSNEQQALDADLKTIQQINFSGNLDEDGNTTIFFVIKEAKETSLGFSQVTVSLLKIYFAYIIYYQHKIT